MRFHGPATNDRRFVGDSHNLHSRSNAAAAVPRSVRLLLFGPARSAVGRAVLDRALPAEGERLGDLIARLGSEYAALRPVLKASRLVVNGRYAKDPSVRLHDGDEVAIHPPYSGG